MKDGNTLENSYNRMVSVGLPETQRYFRVVRSRPELHLDSQCQPGQAYSLEAASGDLDLNPVEIPEVQEERSAGMIGSFGSRLYGATPKYFSKKILKSK